MLRRIILVGILICYIAAAAIELAKWSNNNVGNSFRVWPSWGWICAIVAGVLWFLAGSLAACKPQAFPSLMEGTNSGHACREEYHCGRHPLVPCLLLCRL